MTLIRKKDRREPTPEELAEASDANRLWEEYLKKHKDKNKPDWMIDENSTPREILEFHAYTVPFKVQQMIDICERQANSLSDFAYNVYADNPQEKERWLKQAEDFRQQVETLRSQKHFYRLIAEKARKELK